MAESPGKHVYPCPLLFSFEEWTVLFACGKWPACTLADLKASFF